MDDNLTTRWASNANNCWVMLDLGQQFIVHEVFINWYKVTSHVYNFSIQFSNDKASWNPWWTGKDENTVGFEKYNTGNAVGRYMRVIGNDLAINEIVLFGDLVEITPNPTASIAITLNPLIVQETAQSTVSVKAEFFDSANQPTKSPVVSIYLADQNHTKISDLASGGGTETFTTSFPTQTLLRGIYNVEVDAV